MTYKLNKASLDLIKSFEGWRAKAYKCPAGVWTIGYGHTSMAGPPKVTKGMTITQAQGDEMLQQDLQKYAKAVDDAVKVPLNPNQFGVLSSFCYNVGPRNFRKSSVLKRVNEGKFNEVPGRLLLWNKGGGKVLRGLTRRRKAEGALFLANVTETPVEAPVSPTGTVKQKAGLAAVVAAIIALVTAVWEWVF